MAARRDFKGKTVVITGAAGGLGSSFAQRFARAGARLALLDLDGTAAAGLAQRLQADGAQAMGLACDVTDPDSCQAAMEQAIEAFGGVDVLINNAGITHRSAFVQTSTEVYQRVMAVNYFGSLYCTQAAMPSLLERQGIIVVISSVAGFAPLYGRTGYAASKHALHGLFESLRVELANSGVQVTIVCPGFTDTGIAHAALDGDGSVTTHRQSTVGRISTPTEVAQEVFEAASKNRRLVVLSAVGKLTRLVSRLCPPLYDRMMLNSLKSELQR